jgi:anti-sigma-K factor RskA
MEHDAYNELTAGYALDALDDDETRAYEEHLAGCTICQDNLAALSGTMVQLAFAAPPVDPPPALRERILAAARAERQSPAPAAPPVPAVPETNVVPFRPRRWEPSTRTSIAAVVAIAACLVIGLGIWNVSLSNQLDNARSASAPTTVPIEGADGSVVVAGNNGVLVVSNLEEAPVGKTYEAWVIDGETARPAGTFGGGGTVAVKLEHPVRNGSVVAVTVEREGGSEQPTSKPFITSQPV